MTNTAAARASPCGRFEKSRTTNTGMRRMRTMVMTLAAFMATWRPDALGDGCRSSAPPF